MSRPTSWHLLRFLADGVGTERRPGGHAHHAGGTGQGRTHFSVHSQTRIHTKQAQATDFTTNHNIAKAF